MKSTVRITIISCLLCFTSLVDARTPIRLFSSSSKMSVQQIRENTNSIRLTIDKNAAKTARSLSSITIESIALPTVDGIPSEVTVDLDEFFVTGPQTYVVLQRGNVEVPGKMPTVKLYRGTVRGAANTLAYVAIEENGSVTGFIRFPEEHFTIGVALTSEPAAMITQSSTIPGQSAMVNCEMHNETLYGNPITLRTPSGSQKGKQAPQAATKSVTVAFDADDECYQHFGSDESAVTNYWTARLGAISSVYELEVDCAIVLGRFKIYTTPDPFTAANMNAMLTAFTDYWKNNNGSVDRTIAHLISRQDIGGGGASGLAWLNVLCSKVRGYGTTRIMGSTQFPAVDENVVAHEIGHNFGSSHTHNCQAYPPDGIDHCVAAEGGCSWNPVQVAGSIMSYCNSKTFSFDTPNDHRVIEVLTQAAADAPCLGSLAEVTFKSESIDFKKLNLGSKKDSTLIAFIQSTGSVPLNISNITIEDEVIDSEFLLKNLPKFPKTLNENETINLTITFTPKDGGDRTSTLKIYSNAAGSPQTVSLMGYGAAPVATLITQTVNYGDINVNTFHDTTFTYIRNDGEAPLIINKLHFSWVDSADFSVTSPVQFPYTIQPGQTSNLTVRLAPKVIGEKTAFLDIYTNAETEPSLISFDANIVGITAVKNAASIASPRITANPNPFSGTLHFDVQLPQTLVGSKVDIAIYDALGHTVASLFNDKMVMGSSLFEWKPDANISAGIYTLLVRIADNTWTQQIVYMK